MTVAAYDREDTRLRDTTWAIDKYRELDHIDTVLTRRQVRQRIDVWLDHRLFTMGCATPTSEA